MMTLYYQLRFALQFGQVLRKHLKQRNPHPTAQRFFYVHGFSYGRDVASNTRPARGILPAFCLRFSNVPPARVETGKTQTGVATMRKNHARALARLALSRVSIIRARVVASSRKGGRQ